MKAILNASAEYNLEYHEGSVVLDGERVDFDVQPLPGQFYHILCGSCSFTAELLENSDGFRRISLRLGGRIYRISLKEESELLMESMGYRPPEHPVSDAIRAPMPGLIAEVLVEVGQNLQEGDPVAVLHAMKMENLIKSPGSGTVRIIPVTKGQNVEKGDPLVQF